MLLVHAHPDDETLWTGPTMARYAAEGVHVTLVTCTLGEEGEVIPAALRHLEADADALGAHRRRELAEAVAALGVTDHRILAGGRWRDSGMTWVDAGVAGPSSSRPHPDAFVEASDAEAVGALLDVLRDVRPQVVVTYDPGGGYGHPDHIRAHEITMAATELARADGYPMTIYWIRVPRSWAEEERRLAGDEAARPASMSPPAPGAGFPPAVVEDELVTTVVDGTEYLPRVRAALAAHATQVRIEGDWFALSDGQAHRLRGRNAYQRVDAPFGTAWGDDLFS